MASCSRALPLPDCFSSGAASFSIAAAKRFTHNACDAPPSLLARQITTRSLAIFSASAVLLRARLKLLIQYPVVKTPMHGALGRFDSLKECPAHLSHSKLC